MCKPRLTSADATVSGGAGGGRGGGGEARRPTRCCVCAAWAGGRPGAARRHCSAAAAPRRTFGRPASTAAEATRARGCGQGYRQLLQSGYERLLRVECCPEQVGGKLGKVERIRIRF